MLFAKTNRASSEVVRQSIKNVQGATITTGLPVAYAGTNSLDGVSAVLADAAADYPRFAGVALSDIPNNDYGLIQVNGYVGSMLLSHTATSVTINAGDPLVPISGMFGSAAAPTWANGGFRWVIAASNVPAVALSAAGQYCSGLIRNVI